MNWKTTLIALAVLFTAVGIGGGGAHAEGHCQIPSEELLTSLTGEYNEALISTGDTAHGVFSLYGEPLDPAAGSELSPETRTVTFLQDIAEEEGRVCLMTTGTNLRILPLPREVYQNGFQSVISMLRDQTSAFIVMVNPDTKEWHVVNIFFIGTPFQSQQVVTVGTNFQLLADPDPAPEPVEQTTPWDG